MQKKFRTFQKPLAIFGALLCLISIRFFENHLFYDPLLSFFKGDDKGRNLPEFDYFLIGVNYFLRFGLNSLLSLLIIFNIFNDKKIVSFAGVLYILFFVVLIISFFSIVIINDNSLNMILFYVRRFIIQPILLLLFVPAFFYQTAISKK